jgi:ribosome recycling factor
MDFNINNIKSRMDKVIEALEKNFSTVRAGRANPAILDGIMVSYYGTATPLRALTNISVPESRQLLIKPFDRSALGAIEKAIFEANLGLTPSNDGETIRIIIPALTEERRIELTKQVKLISEEARISLRNIRHDIINEMKQNDLSEDEEKNAMSRLQNAIDEYNKKIDDKLKEKDNDLLKI